VWAGRNNDENCHLKRVYGSVAVSCPAARLIPSFIQQNLNLCSTIGDKR
jgi:hypothetical protein